MMSVIGISSFWRMVNGDSYKNPVGVAFLAICRWMTKHK